MVSRYGESSSKAAAASVLLADKQALAAKAQRDHVDAMVAAESAHAGLAKAAGKTADSVGQLQRLGSSPIVNAVGIGSVGLFGAALVTSTDAAAKVQTGLERVHSVTGETTQNLKIVSDGMLKLMGQVGYSAPELNSGLLLVEKAGYRGADGIKVLTAASQLASEEGADLNDTISAVTTSLNDFHIPVDQATTVTSKLNTAVGLSKVPLQEFTGSLHNIEPIAAGVGDSLNDVYAALAMLTQSGSSADQASQNLAHTFTSLAKPTQQMQQEMGQLGLDWRDVQQHLGDRGIIGTANMLHDAVTTKLGPSGQVMLDTWMKSQSASDSANAMMAAMPPQVRAVAESIDNNTLSYAEFRRTRGGLSVEQANEINQWKTIEDKLKGFNSTLKSGQGDVQGEIQALANLVGGQDNLRTILQLTGENQAKANDTLKQVTGTTADANHQTKGFVDSQKTYNAQMKDFKGALEATRIELGQDFLPAMTTVVHTLGDGARWLSEHKTIMDGLVGTVGTLGGAYVGLRTALGFRHLLDDLKTGFGGVNTAAGTANTTIAAAGPAAATGAAGVGTAAAEEVTAEERVTAAATEADTALSTGAGLARGALGFLGPVAAGLALGPSVGHAAQSFLNSPTMNWANEHIRNPVRNFFGASSIPDAHADGGPLNAPGPKGRDSALFWGARGEHVLTADDVDAMGGHSGVYAFRHALHRDVGGAVGADALYAEAQALNGQAYRWGSTDCSGAVSMLVDAALGGSGRMNTNNAESWLAARGFQPGFQPGALNVGWYNQPGGPGGGHMAATLPDGTHFESGGQHGNIMLGGSAAGAETSEFTNHMFLPMEGLYPDGPAGGGGSGAMGMGSMGGFGGGGASGGGSFGGGGASPAAMTAASNRVQKAQDRLTEAQEHEAEVSQKATAKQSERDRAKDQVAEAERELAAAQQNQAQVQREGARVGRGGAGGHGGLFDRRRGSLVESEGVGGPGGFGVPLPDRFGLGKGLPGLAEWLVDFVGDMAVAPWEATMAAQAGLDGFGGASGAAGGYSQLPSASAYTTGLPFTPGSSGPASSGPGGGGVETAAAVEPSGGSAPVSSGSAPAAPSPQQASSPRGYSGTSSGWFGAGSYAGTPAPSSAPAAMTPLVPPWAQRQVTADQLFPGRSNSSTPPNLGAMISPGYTGAAPNWIPTFGDPIRHFSTGGQVGSGQQTSGGPRGTDTVPAWLTPGEQVLTVDQAKAWEHAQYFSGGSGSSGVQDTAATTPAPAPAPTPSPQQKQVQPKSSQGETPSRDTSDKDAPQTATGGGVGGWSGGSGGGSKGLGIQGGALGAAEGAAAMGADAFAPGSGAAVQMASQLVNRTIAYGGQMAAIGVQGLMSTFLPSDSPLSDFGNTLPGKILTGISGAKPNKPPTAGATQAPLKDAPGASGGDKGQGETPAVGMQINGMTVQASNADQFKYQMAQTQQQYQMGAQQYATSRK